MSGFPIPAGLLKPLADQALKLAADRLGKGNPLVGMVLSGVQGLIEEHGSKIPPELVPAKRQISASLAADFEAMEGAFGRAEQAGKFKG